MKDILACLSYPNVRIKLSLLQKFFVSLLVFSVDVAFGENTFVDDIVRDGYSTRGSDLERQVTSLYTLL